MQLTAPPPISRRARDRERRVGARARARGFSMGQELARDKHLRLVKRSRPRSARRGARLTDRGRNGVRRFLGVEKAANGEKRMRIARRLESFSRACDDEQTRCVSGADRGET